MFHLSIRLPEITDQVLDHLNQAGCGDADVQMQPGQLTLIFNREGPDGWWSAIVDINRAGYVPSVAVEA